MLVKEEDSVKLRVGNWIVVSVVLVIVEIQEVVSVVHTAEGVVREGGPATVNLHGALRTSKIVINIHNIVGKLDGITKNKHPGFAEVGNLRRLGIDTWVMDEHHFFSSSDTYL